MWRILVAVGCIIAVLICGYTNLVFSDRLCDATAELIRRSITAVDLNGSDGGAALHQARERWSSSITWLCAFVAHEQLDEAQAAFARAESYRSCEDWVSYRAELVSLLSVLSVIRSYDHPHADNLL